MLPISFLLLLDPSDDTDTKLRSPSEDIHIETAASTADPDPEMVFMVCCGAARTYPDGSLDPKIDFYSYQWGARATCKDCKALWVASDG